MRMKIWLIRKDTILQLQKILGTTPTMSLELKLPKMKYARDQGVIL